MYKNVKIKSKITLYFCHFTILLINGSGNLLVTMIYDGTGRIYEAFLQSFKVRYLAKFQYWMFRNT